MTKARFHLLNGIKKFQLGSAVENEKNAHRF